MDERVLSGDYVDLKFIKTRKVLQIVIEMPIEAGPIVVQAFGTPLPDSTVPVAIARLETQPDQTQQHRPFDEMSRAQQAGILCGDTRFQEFLLTKKNEPLNALSPTSMADQAATAVRKLCGVNSRANFSSNPDAASKWEVLEREYRKWA